MKHENKKHERALGAVFMFHVFMFHGRRKT
jgi:hypothetical protein